jgi:hypothetical protein
MEKIYKREYKLPKIEFYKYQLNRSINCPEPVLNETDITILAYIYVYGNRTTDMIIRDRILTSRNSCVNYIVKLKKLNYAVKDPDLKLNPNLQISDTDYIEVVTIHKTDEEKVYHPYYRQYKEENSPGAGTAAG